MSTGKENNEQLVQKIKAGEDVTGNMAKLWQQNRNFVYLIARKYAKTETDIDDLMQEGYLGMYRAIGPYDLSAGVAFLSYASFWIRQGMQRYIQDNKHLHIPYNLQEKVLRYQRFLNTYRMRFGKNPTDEQICCRMRINYETLDRLKTAAEACKAGSMDKEIEGTEGVTFGDTIADPENHYENVLDNLEREELKSILWTLVDDLPGKAPEVLRMRYKQELTLKETGEAMGINMEAVRQWQQKGLRELRRPSRSNLLREFYKDGEIYSRGVVGGGVGTFNRNWTSSTERTALDMIERRF